MNKNIGDMTESELKDFIIELQEENSRYERLNQKYKEVIDKALDFIDCHFKEMVADEESQELKSILEEVNRWIRKKKETMYLHN